jgi:hypothetical protein
MTLALASIAVYPFWALIIQVRPHETVEFINRLAFLSGQLTLNELIPSLKFRFCLNVMSFRKMAEIIIFVHISQGHVVCPRSTWIGGVVVFNEDEAFIRALVVMVREVQEHRILVTRPVLIEPLSCVFGTLRIKVVI